MHQNAQQMFPNDVFEIDNIDGFIERSLEIMK
jgi:hypothetical protein